MNSIDILNYNLFYLWKESSSFVGKAFRMFCLYGTDDNEVCLPAKGIDVQL